MHSLNPYDPSFKSVGEALVAQTEKPGPRRHKGLRLALGAYSLAVFLGLAIAAYNIETIVGSGPVLLFVGAVLAAIGFRNRDTLAVMLGMSSFVLAALVIALINLVPYSPTTGYWPLLATIGLYTCVSLPTVGWMVVFRRDLNIEEVG